MTRCKGTRNVHTIVEPEFHPFTPSEGCGEATQLDSRCTWCGESLWSFPWNSKGNIVTCQNDKCPAFKRPVSRK